MTKFHIFIIQILQNITFSTFIPYTNSSKTSNNTIFTFCQKITIFDIFPYFFILADLSFSPFSSIYKKSPFFTFLWDYQKSPVSQKCQNAQKWGFREIPQNWDFGGRGDEHTRKAWCGNYFKNNPWIPILHTSIKGVYFILFVSHWFSVNFIFGYFITVEENVIKWKKMVVDVQN